MRVRALVTWLEQAKKRLKLIAQAVAICCKCVLVSPKYRVLRKPNLPTP